jgi:hypothetical protein
VPRAPVGLAGHLEMLHRLAVLEARVVRLAAPPDAQIQPVAERVDHADADAVQTARDLVGVLVEFPAGMELGHDDLGRAHPLFGVKLHGNAAAVVADRNAVVGVQGDADFGRVAGQRLVDAVVDDLVDHVVQARAVIGVADIHARALADSLQPLENLDGICAVVIRLLGGFRHARVPLRFGEFIRGTWGECHVRTTIFGVSPPDGNRPRPC